MKRILYPKQYYNMAWIYTLLFKGIAWKSVAQHKNINIVTYIAIIYDVLHYSHSRTMWHFPCAHARDGM